MDPIFCKSLDIVIVQQILRADFILRQFLLQILLEQVENLIEFKMKHVIIFVYCVMIF